MDAVRVGASPLSVFKAQNLSNEMGDLQTIASRAANGKDLSEKEVEKVGKQFESLLLHQLLSAMRKTVPKNDLFDNSSAHEMFQDMFDQHIASIVAESGQTGIGASIAHEIMENQKSEKPPAGDSPSRSLHKEDPPLRKIDGTRFYPLNDRKFSPIPRNQFPRHGNLIATA